MFAYCGSNPVSRKDDGGEFWHIVAGAAVGGLLGGISKAIELAGTNESTGKVIAQVLVSTACGAVGGALAATGIGAAGQVIIGGVLGAAESAANQMISQGNINKTQLAADTLSGAVGGYAGGKGAAHGSKFMSYHKKQFVKNLSLEGFDKAATKFVRHTWQWSKNHLGRDTIRSVVTAFIGNKWVNRALIYEP